MRSFKRYISIALSALLLTTTGAFTTSCAAAAQWWQNITSSPGSAIAFLQYVISFIEGLVSLWNTIAPLLPATSQAQANSDFNNAVYSVEQACAALQDAIRAAAAAQQSSPDFTALIGNVQAAVAALMSIFQKWQGTTSFSSAVSPSAPDPKDIIRQAGVIAGWK
jgi:hypothetical protein